MKLVSLRSTGIFIIEGWRWRLPNDRLYRDHHSGEKQRRADASEKALKHFDHGNISCSAACTVDFVSTISTGSTAASQPSQCSSIISAIDRIRRQPGHPQKRSKYPARKAAVLLLLPVTMPSPLKHFLPYAALTRLTAKQRIMLLPT
ncbi:hypothetical protein [Rhizobium multihospitium]|uniref:hypothetical protein n=1 Tax=Rhizobium multihospitium TaxID=410764 RepID=UPI00114C86C0|nr:hypothetical protein [Rhizobium multihospitium]